MAIAEMCINKDSLPHKVTSELLRFIYKLCPTLFMKVCQNISDLITGKAKNYLWMFVIFFHKNNTNKTNYEML